MPTFLHAADLHVGSPLRGLSLLPPLTAERLRGATRHALRRLVDLALDKQVQFVVLAGDVYDTQPSVETALYFRSEMLRLHEAGIPVVIVLGNHDHAGVEVPNTRLPATVQVLPADRAATVSPVAGVCVHGRSYPRQDFDEDLTVDYPDTVRGALNVGLLHTALDTGGSAEHGDYAPTSRAKLEARGYQYWALGHVHGFQNMNPDACPMVFSGNLQGRHARETGPKGAVLVDYEGDRVVGFAHHALDVMRWHYVAIDVDDGQRDVAGAAAERIRHATAQDRDAGRPCVVRVQVTASARATADLDDLRTELLGLTQDASDDLSLEKVSLELRTDHGVGSEIERQLRAIAEGCASDPDVQKRLGECLRDIRDEILKVDRALLSDKGRGYDPEMAALFDATRIDEARALSLLVRGLERVRPLLRKVRS